MSSLKNHILISMPHMQDAYFAQSVILLAEHTEEGAMGLIVNRPFEEPDLKKLFVEVYQEGENFLKMVPQVYFGGPVMIERGIILHSAEYESEGTFRFSDDFALTSHKDILEDIAHSDGPEKFKLMLGHAGWDAGQLEREIENGDWLLQGTSSEFVFDYPVDNLWKSAAKSFGIDMSEMTGMGGQA